MRRLWVALAIALVVMTGAGYFDVKGGYAMAEDRFEKGYRQLKALNPEGADETLGSLQDLAPHMGRFVVEFGYGDVYSRSALDIKSRQIATIAALTALGNATPQLRWHIAAALNVGVSPEEIIETFYVMTVYAGFPAGLNGIAAAWDVFRARSIVFTPVKRAESGDRHARGMKTLEETSKGAGRTVVESLAGIAPQMADFIIDFSYGDIFSRKALSSRLKEIAAIAGMTAAGTMAPQLKVHIRAALNVGVTREEIIEVLTQMAVYAGFPAALNGIGAAREVFAE